MDVVLQVAHQHQVTGLVPARVQGMVVDVAEDGAGTDAVGAILGVDELAEAVHDHGAVLALALLLVLFGLNSRHNSTNHTQSKTADIMVGHFVNLTIHFLYLINKASWMVSYLGLSLEAQAAPVGLVVELVVGVHDSAQVDAANLLCAALPLQVAEQAVNDATNTTLIFQIVYIF